MERNLEQLMRFRDMVASQISEERKEEEKWCAPDAGPKSIKVPSTLVIARRFLTEVYSSVLYPRKTRYPQSVYQRSHAAHAFLEDLYKSVMDAQSEGREKPEFRCHPEVHEEVKGGFPSSSQVSVHEAENFSSRSGRGTKYE